jgi:uroporphyrinogen III methyltransferase/synthase
VILVGAGPGDPGLLTRRGAEVLAGADVVIYDALASKRLLTLAPNAEHVNVGKRGHDEPTRSQPETTALLLEIARSGRTVVRLKGGDPYVFGRGGEESTACAEAGIPFEVVPGISSVIGALAYAGIPVTDRRHSASFAVVTGHKDPTRVSEETRWRELGTAVDTLVILMGMRNLEQIVAQILAGGRSPETPSAAVESGTLPIQRVVEAPLAELPARVRAAGLGAPAVVVIGEVVRLRETLAWYERQPLFGKRVLVTRAREQAGEIVAALEAAGAEAVQAPMIRFVPPVDFAPTDAAIDDLEGYDAVLLSSANAVRFFAERMISRGRGPADTSLDVFCVGPRTAEAALAAGFPVHRIPEGRYDAEGLLAVVEKWMPPAGRRFLVPRPATGGAVLSEGLRAAGATVDEVVVYRTLPAEVDADALRGQLGNGEVDALTFTSPSTVHNFAALLDPGSRRALGECRVAAIGPTTAEALRREGFSVHVVPEQATVAGLVAALAAEFGAAGAGLDSGPASPSPRSDLRGGDSRGGGAE